jgi:hypothetical protein
MTSSRRSTLLSAPLRRPAGPRCHGGASSLLRLGFGASPPRVAAARASGWCELADPSAASVEHVIGMPLRAPSAAALAS